MESIPEEPKTDSTEGIIATTTGLMDEAGDKLPSTEEVENPKLEPVLKEKRRPAIVLPYCHFLSALHAKCKTDLVKLGCVNHAYDKTGTLGKRHRHAERETWEKRMKRLKVYQRAFSAIVMYFKAYSPVLLHIKKTYEDMLSYRIDQIKLAHFEKRRLHIRKQTTRHQMTEYQFPEYGQLLKVEKYLHILRQRISLQDDAIKVITGILTRMEDALSDHFERHRDLEEQIIMIDTEMTNRRQKAYIQREKELKEEKEAKEKDLANHPDNEFAAIDSDEEDKEDPWYEVSNDDIDDDRKMVWIIAFAVCHQDLEVAEAKVAMYQTRYQNVVPRRELENMKSKITDEKVRAKELAAERKALETMDDNDIPDELIYSDEDDGEEEGEEEEGEFDMGEEEHVHHGEE